MQERKKKSSPSISGEKHTVVGNEPSGIALEQISGIVSLFLAVVASSTAVHSIILWDAVIAGTAGFFGAFSFLNSMKLSENKIVAVCISGGLASIFGPIVANFLSFQFPWVGDVSYFLDAAAGCLLGLLSTPLLAILRDPSPALTFLATFIPFLGKIVVTICH